MASVVVHCVAGHCVGQYCVLASGLEPDADPAVGMNLVAGHAYREFGFPFAVNREPVAVVVGNIVCSQSYCKVRTRLTTYQNPVAACMPDETVLNCYTPKTPARLGTYPKACILYRTVPQRHIFTRVDPYPAPVPLRIK